MHLESDCHYMSLFLRLVVVVVGRVQRCLLEIIFALFESQTSVFATNNVELSDHVVVFDDALSVYINSQ